MKTTKEERSDLRARYGGEGQVFVTTTGKKITVDDLLDDINELAAEVAQFKGEVERWRVVSCRLLELHSHPLLIGTIKHMIENGDLTATEAALGITPQSDTAKEAK